MTPERTQAYRRVVKTLSDLGPSKLLEPEQGRIRDAADELIFCRDPDDGPAREAIADIESLSGALVASGRWEQISADRLLDDVAACGPARQLQIQAA